MSGKAQSLNPLEKKKITDSDKASDLLRYYWPNMTDQEIDFFIWELTPFPFCTTEHLEDFVFKVYQTQLKKLGVCICTPQDLQPLGECICKAR